MKDNVVAPSIRSTSVPPSFRICDNRISNTGNAPEEQVVCTYITSESIEITPGLQKTTSDEFASQKTEGLRAQFSTPARSLGDLEVTTGVMDPHEMDAFQANSLQTQMGRPTHWTVVQDDSSIKTRAREERCLSSQEPIGVRSGEVSTNSPSDRLGSDGVDPSVPIYEMGAAATFPTDLPNSAGAHGN